MENPAIKNQQSSIEILPVSHTLNATLRVPGSKSLTNRVMLVASLAEGTTTLTNALFSDDSCYFAESLTRLGFEVQSNPQLSTFTVSGHGGLIPSRRADLYVGNAGTAARFLTAMLTLGNGEYVVDGDARMRHRPVGDLIDTLTQLGASVTGPTGCIPVRVLASGLCGGRASVAGNVSSQFLSGLLMVAPSAQSEVELNVEHGLNSKPYVDMTLTVMSDFGVEISRDGYERFVIRSARYQSRETYAIESDASAASYFFAAPAILGGSVRVENISRQSKQGDIAFLGILQQMGCVVADGPDFIEVTGPDRLSGIDVDMRDISDTAQTLAVIAPFASSPTRIRGIGFIRKKETDRIAAVCTELTRLGVEVQENSDGMTIQPCASIRPACVQTYKDHRMAMAFALIGLRAPGISIENPACVSKTFPNYFEMLETLR
jgi:3-phosphoshikimate 1-carboxyvinyltransferase